ncbi:putative dynein heavy chain fragment [Phakopsora pachyrhizi]|uniref:Dynein heavy chain n=1 Tax=Phakopsora pachyrhizi TaxID=170000 RepID=A0AAV0B2W7_PHAPC|nr:putative dynein heavy chain fragment [Phakopsora pachyrhizi]
MTQQLRWVDHLNQASLKYKSELPLAKFLSTADDQLGWQSKLLPPDDLCTENTIMLKRFNHYPLVLDPSGQATIFLMNEYKDQNALRKLSNFGTPLLIQDVEHLDPILNAVLNKELC